VPESEEFVMKQSKFGLSTILIIFSFMTEGCLVELPVDEDAGDAVSEDTGGTDRQSV